MVGVSASVSLPLHRKVQKFSSGTGSLGQSRKSAVKQLWCSGTCFMSWMDALPVIQFNSVKALKKTQSIDATSGLASSFLHSPSLFREEASFFCQNPSPVLVQGGSRSRLIRAYVIKQYYLTSTKGCDAELQLRILIAGLASAPNYTRV